MTYAENCCVNERNLWAKWSTVQNQTKVFWPVCFEANRRIKSAGSVVSNYYHIIRVDVAHPVPAVTFAVMKS